MKGLNKRRLIGFLIIIIGLLTVAYPWIADYVNKIYTVKEVSDYNTEVAKRNKAEVERLIATAKEYNSHLPISYPADPFTGTGINQVTQKGYEDFELLKPGAMLGYVEVPSADIYTAVYYGTSNKVIEKGAGVVENSSLPVGGEGSHSVIAGHNGMASRRIFTDLGRVKKGDVFFVHVLNQNFAYKVDQIKTVLPDQVEYLRIEKDKDYVTLLTCTPFGVNDHRLLVRGHRIPYDFSNHYTAEVLWKSKVLWIALAVLAVIICYLVWRKKKNKRGGDEYDQKQ